VRCHPRAVSPVAGVAVDPVPPVREGVDPVEAPRVVDAPEAPDAVDRRRRVVRVNGPMAPIAWVVPLIGLGAASRADPHRGARVVGVRARDRVAMTREVAPVRDAAVLGATGSTRRVLAGQARPQVDGVRGARYAEMVISEARIDRSMEPVAPPESRATRLSAAPRRSALEVVDCDAKAESVRTRLRANPTSGSTRVPFARRRSLLSSEPSVGAHQPISSPPSPPRSTAPPVVGNGRRAFASGC